MASPSPSPDVERLARDIRAGERTVLSRAITLIESKRADHRRTAAALTQALLRDTGNAVRVGITGAPGVGKSTMIDALGSMLTKQGRKVAVLAAHRRIDPGRQNAHGAARHRRQCLYPSLAVLRHAWRRRRQDARDHAALRGR